MKQFVYEEKIIYLENKLNISRKNKCLIVINSEIDFNYPKLSKRKISRSKSLVNDLRKKLYRV